MTVEESVAMLTAKGLTVTRRDFSTEREYYASLGWPTKHAKDHPVTLLIAENPHHAKHLRFQWNHENGGSRLYDMAFGDYDYELFIMDVPDEGGLEWLEEMVDEVLRGDIHVINRTNARTGRWEADACFTHSDEPEMDNMDEYAAALARIRKRDASWFHPFGRNTKYEIYSWDSYECITV